MSYLKPRLNKEKIVSLIVGGPNQYYDYKDIEVEKICRIIRDIDNETPIIVSIYRNDNNSKYIKEIFSKRFYHKVQVLSFYI